MTSADCSHQDVRICINCLRKAEREAYERGLEAAARMAEEFEDINTQDYYGEEIALSIRALKEVKR